MPGKFRLTFIVNVCIISLVMFLSFSFAAPAPKATIHVSSASELMKALAHVRGSATILLQPGDYGDLVLHDQKNPFVKFSAPVTIKSADVQNLARIKSLKLIGAQNLSFGLIHFNYVAADGAPEWTRPNEIAGGSRDIVIEDSVFEGDVARGARDGVNGYGTGVGLSVRESTNITIRNNKFFTWHRAAVFSSVNHLSVVRNEVYGVRSDGFNFAQVDDVLIEGNHLHDFIAAVESNDHLDMIQFWTSGTARPSTNIVIRSNVLISGHGAWTQSIFIRNEMVDTKRAGDEMFYRNITIENNVIFNAHAHGISVGETHGLTIRNNTVLQNRAGVDDKLVHVPRIVLLASESTAVLIEDNVVSLARNPKLTLPSAPNANIRNNLIVQRDQPGARNYYGRVFVNALADADAKLADLRAIPGEIPDKMGSSLARFPERPDTLAGFIQHQAGIALSSLSHTFNARNLFGSEGRIEARDVLVVWSFGDGAEGRGLTTTHTYARAGTYNVRAVVTLRGGRSLQLVKTIVAVAPAAERK